jgi:hypothetical protein
MWERQPFGVEFYPSLCPVIIKLVRAEASCLLGRPWKEGWESSSLPWLPSEAPFLSIISSNSVGVLLGDGRCFLLPGPPMLRGDFEGLVAGRATLPAELEHSIYRPSTWWETSDRVFKNTCWRRCRRMEHLEIMPESSTIPLFRKGTCEGSVWCPVYHKAVAGRQQTQERSIATRPCPGDKGKGPSTWRHSHCPRNPQCVPWSSWCSRTCRHCADRGGMGMVVITAEGACPRPLQGLLLWTWNLICRMWGPGL